MTGVDYAKAAIEKTRANIKESGTKANFIVDGLSNPHHASGMFDSLLDFGTLDDLRLHLREPYHRNMLTLTHSGSHYRIWGFEFPMC